MTANRTTTDAAESDRARAASSPHEARIVVGVDGSDGSLAAVHWAVGEARLRGARLHLVMAWQYPQYYATDGWGLSMDPSGDSATILAGAADTEITRLGKEAGEGQSVTITCEAVEGHPAEVLVRTARSAAMLVVGSRGHGGFVGALLGSVSQHVVAHARCPVVLIPDPSRDGIPS